MVVSRGECEGLIVVAIENDARLWQQILQRRGVGVLLDFIGRLVIPTVTPNNGSKWKEAEICAHLASTCLLGPISHGKPWSIPLQTEVWTRLQSIVSLAPHSYYIWQLSFILISCLVSRGCNIQTPQKNVHYVHSYVFGVAAYTGPILTKWPQTNVDFWDTQTEVPIYFDRLFGSS